MYLPAPQVPPPKTKASTEGKGSRSFLQYDRKEGRAVYQGTVTVAVAVVVEGGGDLTALG